MQQKKNRQGHQDTDPDAEYMKDAVEVEVEIKSTIIEVPMITDTRGYVNRTLVQGAYTRLTPSQATKLNRITNALKQENATMANGRRVEHTGHSIRWILDNL